jgi:predicted RNA-binding protein with PUA-like domain
MSAGGRWFSLEHMNWLFKEEPSSYSFDQFTRDGGTSWAGVRNPLAQKHLRGVKKGDRVFYYHTGNEKSVVGVAKATSDAYPDPQDKSGTLVVVDIAPVQALKRPVTLAEIKASKAFEGLALTRLPRLSVMPVSDAEWKEIERLSRS